MIQYFLGNEKKVGSIFTHDKKPAYKILYYMEIDVNCGLVEPLIPVVGECVNF